MINRIGTSPNPFLTNVSNTFMRTHQNTTSFDSMMANSASNQGRFAVLDSSALVSSDMRVPGGGKINASVYKAEGYSADNPVFIVKGTNVDGTPFEVEINVKSINPRNASFVELHALDGYYVANGGQELGARRAAASAMIAAEVVGRPGNAEFDAFSKFDFIPPLQEMMGYQRSNGNLSGYEHYRHIIDSLLDFIAQK